MGIGRTNAGGGGLNKSVIIVTAPTGSTVTCSMGSKIKTAPEKNGTWMFSGLSNGDWVVTATLDGRIALKTVAITRLSVTYIELAYNKIPEFTYTGDWEVVDDDDNPITTSTDNWKIRFLTSGTLTITALNGWDGNMDVFLVGAGAGGEYNNSGGGGGGGRTATRRNLTLVVGTPYLITIGAGGEQNTNGGDTSAFEITALGGETGHDKGYGGSGGSGGGAGGYNTIGSGGDDGADGGNSTDASWGSHTGGSGQGTTTREFGTGKIYAGGGGGSDRSNNDTPGIGGTGGGNGAGKTVDATPGTENTGGGGGGASNANAPSKVAAKGGSGIVIIRNAREVA